MIYVLNNDGQPLMPTDRCGRVRHLLKEGKAKMVKRCPFTIQLLYQSTNYTQPIRLGVDAGSKHIGMSATTETKEVYVSEVELRHDITKLLSDRRALRRERRSRKTRYRKPRFQNRKRGEKWLAPSIRHKIQTHLDVTEAVYRILPVTSITVETASFDIQKINDPKIKSTGYQGEQYFIFGRRNSGFFDIRTLDGIKVNKGSLSYKKIQFLETPHGYLTEQRKEMA